MPKRSYTKQVFGRDGAIVGQIYVQVVDGQSEEDVYQMSLFPVRGISNVKKNLKLLIASLEGWQDREPHSNDVITHDEDSDKWE
jgi:hypothetical protein